jgi:hypothetical protein
MTTVLETGSDSRVEKTAQPGAFWLVLFANYSGYKIKNNRVGGPCKTYGRDTNACRFVVGKPDGKWPLGRPGRSRENVKWMLYLSGVACINPGYGRVTSCDEPGDESSEFHKSQRFLEQLRNFSNLVLRFWGALWVCAVVFVCSLRSDPSACWDRRLAALVQRRCLCWTVGMSVIGSASWI